MRTQGEWEITGDSYLENAVFIGIEGNAIALVNKDKAQIIVDCVNACDGINPKAVKPMYEALEKINKLTMQLYVEAEGKPTNEYQIYKRIYQSLAEIYRSSQSLAKEGE